jgi:DNA-binding response OmpR family regulator
MAKRILLVEDHLSTLDLLRSMLEYSSSGRQILGVPSAEEGLLAIRQAPFDLLISDVRLPGMSGFDLVRKVRSIQPELPVIMITGYASPESEEEARRLGVEQYFAKPMDMAALLAAIEIVLAKPEKRSSALGSEPLVTVAEEVKHRDTAQPSSPQREQGQIERRLATLQSDTGARQVILADLAAKVIVAVGESSGLDLLDLTAQLARSMNGSLGVAEKLGGAEPFAIQYHAGQRHDVYSVNVGSRSFIALLFADQTRRGRIGTVWVFAQRAVKDLKTLLELQAAREQREAEEQVPRGRSDKPSHPADELPATVPTSVQEADKKTPAAPAAEKQIPSSSDDADRSSDVDLDAYWEAALAAEQNEGSGFAGLSFEEAVRRGLINRDFDKEEDA